MTTDLEVVVLDETLLDDEPGCEYKHGPTHPCSTEVTHRVIACKQEGNVCATAAEITRWRMENGSTCSGCHQPACDCWYLRPI